MIDRSTDIRAALRRRQGGFLMNPFRFGGGGGGGDPDFASVSLLMHMDGVNGGTSFPDASGLPITMTPVGNVKTSAAQKKFGTASAYFDGNNDYIACATNTKLGFGTGDFCIEMFLYFTDTSFRYVFSLDSQGTSASIFMSRPNGGAIEVYLGGIFLTATANTAANTWYHVAITRASGTARLFIDGVLQASATRTNDFLSTRRIFLGVDPGSYGTTSMMLGYMDEVRITKGVARYTADFTPPAAPFPNF